MGVSTDAILAYGYDLGEANDIDWEMAAEYENDFGNWAEHRLLESLVGFTEVFGNDSKEGYFARKHKAEEEMGLEIIYHCSGDYPMYFLAAKGSAIQASRGYPQAIGSLHTPLLWGDRLKMGMEALGIEPKEDPGWFLFSMWG